MIITLISAALLIILVAVSCNRKSINSNSSIEYPTKQMLLNYLNQKKGIDTETNKFIDTLIMYSNWNSISKTTIYNPIIPNLVSLYYLPINYIKNKTGITFLYNKNTNQVYYSLITQFRKNIDTTKPIDIITGFYNYKLKGYTGTISAFSLSNDFLWEYGYEDGKRMFEKRITSFDPNDTLKNYITINHHFSNTDTIKWHLITIYEDGSNDWKFIGTTMGNDHCEKSIGLTKTATRIKTNCNIKSKIRN